MNLKVWLPFFSEVAPESAHTAPTAQIPKTIHQIWIGPKKKPELYMKSWHTDYIKQFPEYSYSFWDDHKIQNLLRAEAPKLLHMYNQEEVYAGKADIARYYIIYKYGGIYIDADSVWINNKSLDDLLTQAKGGFFIASEPKPNEKYKHFQHFLAQGVFGARIGHSFLRKILDYMRKIMYPNYTELRQTKRPWEVTGPVLVSKLYKKEFNITIFPSRFFYPISWHGITDNQLHTKIDLPKESYMFQYGITTNNLKY